MKHRVFFKGEAPARNNGYNEADVIRLSCLGTRNVLREYLFPLFLCNKITIFVMYTMLSSNFEKYLLVFSNLIVNTFTETLFFFVFFLLSSFDSRRLAP